MYQRSGYQSYPGDVEHANFPSTPRRALSLSSNPIVLDDYNSDLNFAIESDGFTASSLHTDGFEYLWAGARATYGVASGKACFEVVILEKLSVNMPDTERNPHVARVGWSTNLSNLNVGEDIQSFGYGGTGKSSMNNKFFDYGMPYTVNDVITCYIDYDKKCIFFAKNGQFLGKAFDLGPGANGVAFYPHVTIKNMKVWVNFGYHPPRQDLVPGFTMMEHISRDLLVRGTCGPDTRRDCQVIMMVGLPGSGKTVWANKYTADHKDMKVNVLGTNTIMDKMKITGLTRQRNYHGRWDQLIKQASNVLNKMLKIAEKKNRNYILDQTNVYPGARRKKMASFHGFLRVAAVIVNTNEVLQERSDRREREEGKVVPASAVMEMKANFTLPEVGETFDDVRFIEEDQGSSNRLVQEFRDEGKIFKEQIEREEMKRKRADSSSNEGPPSKEQAYQLSRDNRGPQHPHAPTPQYSPRGHGTHDTRPSYVLPNYAPPSRLPPPHYDNGMEQRQDPYRDQYTQSGMSQGDFRQYPHSYPNNYYPNTDAYADYQYTPRGSAYGDTPLSHPVQVSESWAGCTGYEPFSNPSGRQPQEHELRGFASLPLSSGGHQYDNTRRQQNYSPQYQYSRGFKH
ncbi:hypothetical protein QZH41_019217 [Actinostola sp. cb2023]|nr:hypothetical protein QZH41_019217 [Actinostola sp. cb2023]